MRPTGPTSHLMKTLRTSVQTTKAVMKSGRSHVVAGTGRVASKVTGSRKLPRSL